MPYLDESVCVDFTNDQYILRVTYFRFSKTDLFQSQKKKKTFEN